MDDIHIYRVIFSGLNGPQHEDVVPPGGCDFEGTLGILLALDFGIIFSTDLTFLNFRCDHWLVLRKRKITSQVFDHLRKILGRVS